MFSIRYFYLIVLSLIWGSSFILMKKGLEVFSYEQVAALRLFITSFVLIPFVFSALKKIKKKHYVPILVAALFGSGIPAFLFTLAQTYLDSSFVGILNSLTPLFTFCIGIIIFNQKYHKINLLGIFLGLIGAIFLSLNNLNQSISINIYVYLVVFASLLYAISANVIKRYLYDLDSTHIASIVFLIVGPLSGVYIFSTDFIVLFDNNKAFESLAYITILAIICTALAGVMFYKLIKISSPTFATSVTYLIPIVALFWGFIDGEKLIGQYFVGVALIFSGLYLVNKKSVNN
ncbi:MAG: DMT family transporter [Flavobacteriales bacterium]|nr:DMT family transporter [Flavobacteriales bacterium]